MLLCRVPLDKTPILHAQLSPKPNRKIYQFLNLVTQPTGGLYRTLHWLDFYKSQKFEEEGGWGYCSVGRLPHFPPDFVGICLHFFLSVNHMRHSL